MIYVTTTISREKLKLREFEPDSTVLSNSKPTNPTDKKEFYEAAVGLLALIYAEQSTHAIG